MSPLSTLPAGDSIVFSRWLAKTAEKYFEDPKVKKRFEAWKKERERNAAGNNIEKTTA
jgi:hypothetical protein